MRFKEIAAIVVCVVFVGCSKKDKVDDTPVPVQKYSVSGTITSPSGTPLNGVRVAFDGKEEYEDITDAAGKFSFGQIEKGTTDLYFDGKPQRFLNMRDRRVEVGNADLTFDKMLIPWEIEEVDFFTQGFIDNEEKIFSLIRYNFDELKMQPSDFKNLIGSIHLPKYETLLTSVQREEEIEASVSFYSMPNDTEYTDLNNENIMYEDVLSWRKILTISTTTTPLGVLNPVKVNLAQAYADHAEYNHSGTVIIVSDEINETLSVTSAIDLLEIRLPYGDDY
ncbi:carboxypeptidase-like regulatory domain-containing protein [Maribacter sp. 2308TA10-17]|uniref:carboxypeptidase-like regulatory domain-containing protein n=1 Tax=Maribacter sp. 2308TA10-17 TaxID=3386276 RepID=UPI0039BC6DD5